MTGSFRFTARHYCAETIFNVNQTVTYTLFSELQTELQATDARNSDEITPVNSTRIVRCSNWFQRKITPFNQMLAAV